MSGGGNLRLVVRDPCLLSVKTERKESWHLMLFSLGKHTSLWWWGMSAKVDQQYKHDLWTCLSYLGLTRRPPGYSREHSGPPGETAMWMSHCKPLTKKNTLQRHLIIKAIGQLWQFFFTEILHPPHIFMHKYWFFSICGGKKRWYCKETLLQSYFCVNFDVLKNKLSYSFYFKVQF